MPEMIDADDLAMLAEGFTAVMTDGAGAHTFIHQSGPGIIAVCFRAYSKGNVVI